MKKRVTTSLLMALVGFFLGWYTAPLLFAWFVTALDGFFRVPDPGLWAAIYLRFALGVAGLFAAPAWATRLANRSAPSAPATLGYLSIGITVSVLTAIFWHWRIGDFRRDLALDDMMPPTPTSLPCLNIPLAGLIAELCAALLYRCRGCLHRIFEDTVRPHRVARYDY